MDPFSGCGGFLVGLEGLAIEIGEECAVHFVRDARLRFRSGNVAPKAVRLQICAS